MMEFRGEVGQEHLSELMGADRSVLPAVTHGASKEAP